MEIKSGISIPVERNGKHVGELVFDPTDVVFAEKIYDLIANLEQTQAEYEAKTAALEADTRTDGFGLPVNTKDRLKFLREACEDMRRMIDDVFGEGTSDMVFGPSMSLEAIGMFFEELAPHMETARADKVSKYLNREQRRAVLRK